MGVIAMGHLSRQDLSAGIVGTSVCAVFGMSVMMGLSSTMETLCGQVRTPNALGLGLMWVHQHRVR